MRRLAQFVARSSGWLSRRLGRGGGTTLPGVVLLKLRPRAAEELAAPLARGSIAISATNGKTTTARLLRSATDAAGIPTVANTAGSNLLRGVTAALLADGEDAELGLFEVDEAALPSVVDQVKPRVVVLMNLFRDQLDRYGELETLVETWRTMIAQLPADTTLVLNADDPAVAFLGHERANTVWFGVDDTSISRTEQSHAADSTHCPRCDNPLTYDLVGIGHMGHWRCEHCGLARPTPTVSATHVEVRGVDGFDITIVTPSGPVTASVALPGLHNAYNTTAAVAAAQALGLETSLLPAALAETDAAFGRGEHVDIGDKQLVMLLAKNPTGANENVRAALTHTGDLHVVIFLNDRTADGQDVSWIWDVDYEPLFDRVSALTVAGERAHDLALRCIYGGADADALVVEPDPGKALDTALAAAGPGDTVFALPTYTAMLDLRAELVRRDLVVPFWEDA